MTRRLVVASQKGGVGKTTISLNLAVALAEQGCPTLLVDLDPQGAIALSLAKGDTELVGLADLMMERITPEEAVLQTKLPTLRILPRGRLDAADVCEFEQALYGPTVLEGALSRVERGSEVVILDTPSGLGMITRAALTVAQFVLVPVQTELLALRSIGQTIRVIERVKEEANPGLTLLGFLPSMVAKGRLSDLSVLGEIWDGFPVFEQIVPRSDAYGRASERGLPVSFALGRNAPEARRFDLIASDVALAMDRSAGKEEVSDGTRQRELL